MQKRSVTIADGHYATASEVVRDGLRLLQKTKEDREAKLKALRKEVQIGLEDLKAGRRLPIDEAFAELDRRIAGKRAKTSKK
ncbi:MAG: type II toxin-antitoxin system ParD family antitoxin [Candidatus Sumerlaeota bacterium]